MARQKKPHHLKIIAGTDRPDRADAAIELPVLSELPLAPDWLPNAHAIREWHRLSSVLHGAGLLTEASLSALGMLCALHGKLLQLWSVGETPSGHMLAQYRLLANDFGLTPVAQGRVSVAGKKTKRNKFDRFSRPTAEE